MRLNVIVCTQKKLEGIFKLKEIEDSVELLVQLLEDKELEVQMQHPCTSLDLVDG